MDNRQEEFDKEFEKPVNINDAHDALTRFINGKQKLHIPARASDDDMLLSRALMELGELRNKRNFNSQ